MKRKISIIIMALLVSLVVSSCKKDTTKYTDIYKYLDAESECYDPENVRITTSPGVKYSFVIIGARRAILFEHEDLEYEGYIYVKLSYIGDK